MPLATEEAAELELSPEEAELLSSAEEEVVLVASLPNATESEMEMPELLPAEDEDEASA